MDAKTPKGMTTASLKEDARMESTLTMEERTVHGRVLVPMGRVAGRTVYQYVGGGETWRFIPDIKATYLLRRAGDSAYRDFASLEAAVAYVEAFEQQA